MKQICRHESDAILGAMRQVALADGRPLSYADTVSIVAAGRYLLRRHDLADIGTLPAVEPADLVAALHRDRELACEAMKYLAVMALVDRVLDRRKIARVVDYARALDVEEDYLTELVEAASGHMEWVTADMTRKNLESLTGRPWRKDEDPSAWLLPYDGGK